MPLGTHDFKSLRRITSGREVASNHLVQFRMVSIRGFVRYLMPQLLHVKVMRALGTGLSGHRLFLPRGQGAMCAVMRK